MERRRGGADRRDGLRNGMSENDRMNEGDISAESGGTADEFPTLPLSRRSDQPDVHAPDGSEIRLLTDGRHGASKSSMVEVALPAGQVSRPVYHRTVEETWYILEGRGQVWRCPPGTDTASVAPQDVAPGDALVIPTGWRFQFAAGPNGALRFLCHTTPPWPGEDEAVSVETGGLGEPTV